VKKTWNQSACTRKRMNRSADYISIE